MIKIISRTIFALVVVYAAGFGCFLVNLPKQDKVLTTEGAQGLVVFTGGTQRIETAKKIMSEGFTGPVLISGVNEKVHPSNVLGDVGANYIGEITYDYASPSTIGNATMTTEWVDEKDLSHILLVTSYYHMPRSLLLLKRSGVRVGVSEYPVFPKEASALFLLREYTKYLLTYAYIL